MAVDRRIVEVKRADRAGKRRRTAFSILHLEPREFPEAPGEQVDHAPFRAPT